MTPRGFSNAVVPPLRTLVTFVACFFLACSTAHAQLRILDYNVGASGSTSFGPRPGMDAVLQAINAQTKPVNAG